MSESEIVERLPFLDRVLHFTMDGQCLVQQSDPCLDIARSLGGISKPSEADRLAAPVVYGAKKHQCPTELRDRGFGSVRGVDLGRALQHGVR